MHLFSGKSQLIISKSFFLFYILWSRRVLCMIGHFCICFVFQTTILWYRVLFSSSVRRPPSAWFTIARFHSIWCIRMSSKKVLFCYEGWYTLCVKEYSWEKLQAFWFGKRKLLGIHGCSGHSYLYIFSYSSTATMALFGIPMHIYESNWFISTDLPC